MALQAKLREATLTDYNHIAQLHTLSWRTAYKGLLSDGYLESNLLGERQNYWKEKLSSLKANEFVIAAENESGVVGFAAVMDQPQKGYDALLDNLHVHPDLKGQGLGGRLMKEVAQRLLKSGRKSFYLWVLKGNTPAELVYQSKGARLEDLGTGMFGGQEIEETRFVWDDLKQLLTEDNDKLES